MRDWRYLEEEENKPWWMFFGVILSLLVIVVSLLRMGAYEWFERMLSW